MKCLVTGSSGQIGSYVVDACRREGHDVLGMDRRHDPRWTDLVADLGDGGACRRAVQGVDAVIHCAAQVSVQSSMQAPDDDATNNVVCTVRMMHAAATGGVARFVNISSAAVYGDPIQDPIREDHPLAPISPYGAGKAATEAYAGMFDRLHDIDMVTVRPFNVYSPRQDRKNPYSGVIAKFIEAAQAADALTVVGDGTQTRDFVHAADVADVLLGLAEAPPRRRILNIGTGDETRIIDLAALVLERFGGAGIEHVPARPGDIGHSIADTTRLRNVHATPLRGLADGLDDFLTIDA